MSQNVQHLPADEAQRRLDAALEYIAQFWTTFEQRPGMLGTPRDLEPMMFYIDFIEHVLLGADMDAYASWTEFRIEKKYIRGSANLLKESLSDDLDDFVKLQAVRREFLDWRAARQSADGVG